MTLRRVTPLATKASQNRFTFQGSWKMLAVLAGFLVAEFHPIITHKPEGTLTNITKSLLGGEFSAPWFVGGGLLLGLLLWLWPHMMFPGVTGRWLVVLLLAGGVAGVVCWAAAHVLIP